MVRARGSPVSGSRPASRWSSASSGRRPTGRTSARRRSSWWGAGAPRATSRRWRDLADVLGGAVGATRVATDEGWIDKDAQIGQTGVTVAPRLYIGAGVSGAVHHRGGMQAAGVGGRDQHRPGRADLRDRGPGHRRRPARRAAAGHRRSCAAGSADAPCPTRAPRVRGTFVTFCATEVPRIRRDGALPIRRRHSARSEPAQPAPARGNALGELEPPQVPRCPAAPVAPRSAQEATSASPAPNRTALSVRACGRSGGSRTARSGSPPPCIAMLGEHAWRGRTRGARPLLALRRVDHPHALLADQHVVRPQIVVREGASDREVSCAWLGPGRPARSRCLPRATVRPGRQLSRPPRGPLGTFGRARQRRSASPSGAADTGGSDVGRRRAGHPASAVDDARRRWPLGVPGVVGGVAGDGLDPHHHPAVVVERPEQTRCGETAVGRTFRARIWAPNRSGESGFSSGDTALTNTSVPSPSP